MKHTFLRAESSDELVAEYGEAGGPDYNLGQQYSRRAVFATDDPDSPFCVITETAFVNGIVRIFEGGEELKSRDAEVGNDDQDLPCYHDPELDTDNLDDGEYVEFYEREEMNIIYCTDPDDPGGTEVTSDYDYQYFSYLWPRSLAEAEDNCRTHIAATDFERDYF